MCLAAEQWRGENSGAGQSAGSAGRLGAAAERAHHCKGQMYLPTLFVMNWLYLTDQCVCCAECAGESGPGGEGQSPATTNRAGCQRAGSEGLCQTLSNPSGKKERHMLLSDIVWCMSAFSASSCLVLWALQCPLPATQIMWQDFFFFFLPWLEVQFSRIGQLELDPSRN